MSVIGIPKSGSDPLERGLSFRLWITAKLAAINLWTKTNSDNLILSQLQGRDLAVGRVVREHGNRDSGLAQVLEEPAHPREPTRPQVAERPLFDPLLDQIPQLLDRQPQPPCRALVLGGPDAVHLELGQPLALSPKGLEPANPGQARGVVKVLFFSRDEATVEEMVLALRLRWPDLQSMAVDKADNGLHFIEQQEPELVIVCDHLADMAIWEIIKEIRRFADTPILVAARGDGEMDIVKALEAGADDYITMPSNLMVLMARSVALLRRVGLDKRGNVDTPIRIGELMIDPANYEVFVGERRIILTPTEFKLLYLLGKNRHMTLSQDFIRRGIWADDVQATATLKKCIQRLRRKLGDDAKDPKWIKTIHGLGYRLTSPTPVASVIFEG